MLDPLVGTVGSTAHMLLYRFGQFDTLHHIGIVEHVEDDITLRGARVKTRIMLFVVTLYQHHIVLAHGSTEFLVRAPHTHRISFQPADRLLAGHRVSMDADKHIGLVPIGYGCPFVKGDEDIRLAGIYDFHVRAVVFHITSEGQSHVQVDILFFRPFTQSTCIPAPMSGIDDQRERTLVGGISPRATQEQQQK